MSRRMAPKTVRRPHAIHQREHTIGGGPDAGSGLVVTRAGAVAMGLRRVVVFVNTSAAEHRDGWQLTCRKRHLDAMLVWQSAVVNTAGFPVECGYDVSGTPDAIDAALSQRCVNGWQLVDSTRVPVTAQGSGPVKERPTTPRPNVRRPDETPSAIGFGTPVNPAKRLSRGQTRRELVALVRALWSSRRTPDVARYLRDALRGRPRTLRTVGKVHYVTPAVDGPTHFDSTETVRYLGRVQLGTEGARRP